MLIKGRIFNVNAISFDEDETTLFSMQIRETNTKKVYKIKFGSLSKQELKDALSKPEICIEIDKASGICIVFYTIKFI